MIWDEWVIEWEPPYPTYICIIIIIIIILRVWHIKASFFVNKLLFKNISQKNINLCFLKHWDVVQWQKFLSNHGL